MVFVLTFFFAGFQVNVLMRLTSIEQKMEEQMSMLGSVFSSLALSIEEEEDMLPGFRNVFKNFEGYVKGFGRF